MKGDPADTIAAIATPPAAAVRGAVRISGPDVADVLQRIGLEVPDRTAAIDGVVDAGAPIGAVEVRLLYWTDHRSYTGCPSAEIHTIGSPPVLQAILERCIEAGCRAAAAGEFTLRAFLAGRLDLTQAEAVLGVIDSPGGEAFEASLAQLAGNVSRPLRTIRGDLIELLADIEAGLDFVDEDISFVSTEAIASRLRNAKEVVAATSRQLSQRGEPAEVPVVTLRGLPNAGKSRLLNAICGAPVAIVSATAGTTRDVVQQQTVLDGITVLICDTAGIEDDRDRPIAAAANRQSRQRDQTATLRLWCVDAADQKFAAAAAAARHEAAVTSRPSIRDRFVATKIDLPEANATSMLPNDQRTDWIACSSETGEGIDGLRREIAALIRQDMGDPGGTAARCRGSLAAASKSIDNAIALTDGPAEDELISLEIRDALDHIGQVTGEIYTDDILDQVFSRFCIGK